MNSLSVMQKLIWTWKDARIVTLPAQIWLPQNTSDPNSGAWLFRKDHNDDEIPDDLPFGADPSSKADEEMIKGALDATARKIWYRQSTSFVVVQLSGFLCEYINIRYMQYRADSNSLRNYTDA